MILCVDNYDSFVHNLGRYLVTLGQEVHMVRHDAEELRHPSWSEWDALVISPGPCGPQEAGASLDLVRTAPPDLPILGICLGHQVIAEAFGGSVGRSPHPLHGRASWIHHDGQKEFAGLANPFAAGRYHSLIVEASRLPDVLKVSARDEQGLVMALRHRDRPVVGWQFHPESILTPLGFVLLANFLRCAGIRYLPPPASEGLQTRASLEPTYSPGGFPITF